MLLLGTLNRVMIVELNVAAFLVASMVALPVLAAPFRALIGFRSDTHRSAIGWKRVPFIWFGTLYQFGGLAFMPFALILLSGDQTHGPAWAGEALAAAAFVMTGLGLHMTQTAGLALAADQAEPEKRHRVVALLYVMFLAGMALSVDRARLAAARLQRAAADPGGAGRRGDHAGAQPRRALEAGADEPDVAARSAPRRARASATRWSTLAGQGRMLRILAVVALGTAAFAMQDVLLEPYGGEILGLSVAATTSLTAVWALGALAGFALSARRLGGRGRPVPGRGATACSPASPPSRP